MTTWAPEWKNLSSQQRKELHVHEAAFFKKLLKPGETLPPHFKRPRTRAPSYSLTLLKLASLDTWPWDEEDALELLKALGVEAIDRRPHVRKLCLSVLYGILHHNGDAGAALKRATAKAKGRPEKLSDEEYAQKITANNRRVIQDKRALSYYDRMYKRYEKEKEQSTDPAMLKQIAIGIVDKERARGKAAKAEGIRLFLGRVKADLKR
jgi:hypothetical protein